MNLLLKLLKNFCIFLNNIFIGDKKEEETVIEIRCQPLSYPATEARQWTELSIEIGQEVVLDNTLHFIKDVGFQGLYAVTITDDGWVELCSTLHPSPKIKSFVLAQLRQRGYMIVLNDETTLISWRQELYFTEREENNDKEEENKDEDNSETHDESQHSEST